MINESLRVIRLYWGKSQAELAAELGLSQSYISEIEGGQKEVTLELLRKYSDLLGVPMSSLLLFVEQMEGAPPAKKGKTIVAGAVLDFLKRLLPEDAE